MRLDGIEDVYELSSVQEGLLFHNLFTPGAGVYLEQITLTLHGELDVAAFRQSWQTIVDRHPVLRTSFHWEGVGKALQVVHRSVTLDMPELDWRDASPEEQEARYEQFALDDRMRGFAFDKPPLMRLALLRTADDTWKFFWSFSHLLLDGWSFGLCFYELTQLYNALAQGKQPTTLERPRPYHGYVAWWKKRSTEQAEKFWTRHLSGFETPERPLELGSIDRKPPAPGEPSHGMLPDRDLVALVPRLGEVAREHGLTVNTISQGAWMLLLSRYLDRDDVIAGSTGTQRPAGLPGAEQIMGPMLATMPVRAHVDPDAHLIEWLRDLQQDMAEARENADIALPELRRLGGLPGSVPLFDMDLAYENVPVPDMTLHRVEIGESTYDGRPHFPITMIIMPGERLPVPRLVYDRTRFPDRAAQRLIDHFYTALTAIIDNPDRTLSEIPVLPEAERAQLAEFAATEPVPVAATLHEIFAERAREHPDKAAVLCGTDRLTYGELDRRANRLARHLAGLGAGPGSTVGLAMERSTDMLVAVLGVLKSGAAYVPLDLTHPAERLAYTLSDAGALALVTHAAGRDRVPGFDGPRVDLDADAAVLDALGDEPPATQTGLDSPAYLIYTSGSTGRPKGVVVTHRNVARLVAGAGTRFAFRPDDVWSMFHSYAFDVSVFETWGAFCNGATLAVVPRDDARSPEALHALLREHGVTVFSQTPSAFRAYMAVALTRPDDEQPPLRYVVFAGEPLDAPTLTPWIERFGSDRPQLINMYGITEVTVHCTFHRVTGTDLTGGIPNNIGRPLPDVSIHVLDRRGRPAPIGVGGEMYVGGPAVAKGYRNLPELTAERFLPDPFSDDPDARLYRSGDLARYLENGDLEFLGRADQQVKVRGYRIEPGEIETVLRQDDAVREAVVIAREDTPGDRRLVAYVVTGDEDDPTERLRELVRAHLPEHMVPSAVVRLDALPLTVNGKTDREALPAPGGERPDLAAAYVAPRDEREEALVRVWTEVLGVERVGVHDDFFALGGHSLLATRVAFGASAALGIEVPVRLVFDRPTVAAMAADLATATPAAPAAPAPADGAPTAPAAQDAPIARRARVTRGTAEGGGTA
ncbi:amino acid adenylation domain-containing protein [Streptomyces sp. NPDC005925]|uniref:non-ribosomal peptide synthetase n=1 Tax=Streptomyces sp. NPDC005925 TaxID=3157172 RepID=UPI0033D00315